jgi:hypothetical protein
MDDARDPALFEQCVVLMVMDGTKKKKTKEERNPPPPTAPTGRALLFLGLWRDWAPNFPGRKLQARSEQELYVKGSERRERKWSPSEAGQWEEKERERATNHLSEESRRREGKIARPSIRGKEEKKLKQREWKPWLSARAPCMETTPVSYSIRRAGLRFAMAFPRPQPHPESRSPAACRAPAAINRALFYF